MHEDFVNEELVEFEIDGKKWKYKPTTSGEESNWIVQYIKMVDGEVQQDMGILHRLKITTNLREIPYTSKEIKEVIGLDADWNKLNSDNKWLFIGKLKSSIFTKLVKNIYEIDTPKKKD